MRKPVIVLSLLGACVGSVHAQERRAVVREPVVREHERERFRTDHWVLDNRFNHNHYYPAVGYRVPALPVGHVSVTFRGEPFWFNAGVWFHKVGPSFAVVRPPFGIIVPVLPPAYSTVYFGNVPYYYANDVYYTQQSGGYEVVAPPPPGGPTPTAAEAPPQPAPGSWYYCESSRTYYPYVSSCPEGWKTVAATPPR